MRRTEQARPRWAHDTLTALAKALGCGRNQPGKWLARGAPAGPPYDELAWRQWLAALPEVDRYEAKPPTDPALAQTLAEAGTRGYAPAVAHPVLPSAPVVPPGVDAAGAAVGGLSVEQARELNKAYREYLATLAAHRDHQLAVGQLVHVDDLVPLVDALAALALSAFDGLAEVAAEASADPPVRDRIARLLADKLTAARASLAADARQRLEQLLSKGAAA